MAEPFVVHINPSAPQTQAHELGSSVIQSLSEHLLLQLLNPSTQSPPSHGSNQLPNQGSNHEPKQTHNLNSMGELVLQIGQSSTEPPTSTTPSSTLNLKVVEPILLHINSLITTPLLRQTSQSPSSSSPQPTPSTPPTKGQPPSDSDPTPPADNNIQQGFKNIDTQNKLKKHQNGLNRAGSLANLLPTGTVLAFQAITPSLSYNGRCHVFNYYLVAFVILVCSVVCFLSSFIDSIEHEQKLYYGIATCNGLRVFNYEADHEQEIKNEEIKKKLEGLHVKRTDFVHAFVSVFVFLIFAFSSSEVQGCYFPQSVRDHLEYSLVIYLPLVAGILSSFLFSIYPTTRRGIGYTGRPQS